MEDKPFGFGDKVDGNWDRYALCPQCGEKVEFGCKYPASERRCSKGHTWHNEYGVVTKGSHHGD